MLVTYAISSQIAARQQLDRLSDAVVDCAASGGICNGDLLGLVKLWAIHV